VTLALEALLSLDAPRVRRAWDRPVVRAGAALATLAAAVVGVVLVGPVAVTVLVAGLAAYLALLAAVSIRETRDSGPR
jgi:hypothetical protein